LCPFQQANGGVVWHTRSIVYLGIKQVLDARINAGVLNGVGLSF
jgi:hypothetical protein